MTTTEPFTIIHPALLRDLVAPRHRTPPQCRQCKRRANCYADTRFPLCCACVRRPKSILTSKQRPAKVKCDDCEEMTANRGGRCTECLQLEVV